MLPDLTQEQLEGLAAHCFRSPPEFCRIFLGDWFPTKMPWVHRGLFALLQNKTDFLLDFGREEWRDGDDEWTPADLQKILTNFIEEGTGRPIFSLEFDDEDNPSIKIDCRLHICIIMPRGSSKTTVVNASNLMDILYKVEDFFLYISESGDHARRQLGTIKTQLEDNDGVPENEMLFAVFGAHKPPRNSSLKWTEEYIETLKKVMVGAIGRGGQVRGFGKNGKRPGKIVFDDLEDEDSVESDTQRAKDSRWFWRSARPAKRKHTGRDILIGTLLHTDAILNRAIKSSEFTAIRFGAIDRQGDALWPWWMTLEQIEVARQAAAEVGELSGFYLEFMSEHKEDSTQFFPESKIVYVQKGLEVFEAIAEAHDPAISEKRTADNAAFAVVGVEKNGHKHVLETYGQVGMPLDDQIDKYFELHYRWLAHLPPNLQKHGVEAIGFQRALVSMFRSRMVEDSKIYGQKAYFEVEPIIHGTIAKDVRIKGIIRPILFSGHLTFQERYGKLHTQLTDYPRGKKDIPDAVAMAIRLLDPFVMLGLGEEGAEDLEKDQYPPLKLVAGGAP